MDREGGALLSVNIGRLIVVGVDRNIVTLEVDHSGRITSCVSFDKVKNRPDRLDGSVAFDDDDIQQAVVGFGHVGKAHLSGRASVEDEKDQRRSVVTFVGGLDGDVHLSEVRDAVVYFWKEYMDLNLDEKRWDIYPLGFSKSEPSRIIVQAFAFTGEVPVFLGTWSVDWKGVQTRLVSFEKNVDLHISQNGYKIIKDGVEAYQTVEKQEKVKKDETKYLKKKYKQERKQQIKEIKEEYEYTVKGLYADYKDEFRDYKKLRSLSGTTESVKLQEAYKQYLIDQTKKDIEKAEKQIEKKRKEIEKIDKTLDKLYEQTGDTSKYIPEEDDDGNSQEEHSGNSIQS